MLQKNNLQFSTSLGVLYRVKELHKHATLQDTYNYLGKGDFDTIYEVLQVAYNKQNNCNQTVEEFADFLDSQGIGFVKASEIYTEVIEATMYSGLSPEEVEKQKNFVASQIKKN